MINYMSSNNRTVASGFTLIELVVSLTIMAMISAAVFSALRSGLLVWEKGTAHIDDLRRSRVVLELLHESIGGALPFMYAVQAENPTLRSLAFEASHDHLRYVSRTSFKDGPNSVPRWIDIRWQRDPDKQSGALVVEERTILPPRNVPDSAVSWTGRVLEASTCSFDFLERTSSADPAMWTQAWHPASEQLPKAVRIRCSGRSGEMVAVSALEYTVSYAAGLRLN
jgi:prepilin-type N-terminal cleavage/methylation domain-containing protein